MRMLALPFLLLAAACANPRGEAANSAVSALVGMPKRDVLSCAGVPNRTATQDGREILVYERQQTTVFRDVDYEEMPRFSRIGPRLVRREVNEHTIASRCEATFTLRDGVVERLSYNTGRDLVLCGSIVENCLPSGGPSTLKGR